MLWSFLLSDVGPWLVGLLAAGGGAFFWGRSKKRQGAKEQRQKAKEADHDRAEDIRDRVERDRADVMHKFHNDGYRD